MTKADLEIELHNTQVAMREVLEYAYLTAIASEHFAYAELLASDGFDDLAYHNRMYALEMMRESYDLMPSGDWSEKIGYLWQIAHSGNIH